ncbi:MAG: DUF11 domain-containing protein [Acidobacteria bacterium]|nr:DUF11 domain-containing protein [Acidobacteriota bacterium]
MQSLKIINMIQSRTGMRWHRVCGLLVIAAVTSLLSVKLLLAVYAMAGDLDPSYGNGGSIENPIFATGGVSDLKLQADGKALAVGPTPFAPCDYPYATQYRNFLLMRLTSNGVLDNSFGDGGKAELDLGGHDTANTLAIQPNGKILVAGWTEGCSSSYKNGAVVRFTENGNLDSMFGNSGKILLSNISVEKMALQPDGKILVVGQKRFAGDYRCYIARFNPNGSYDYSFGTYGEIYPDVWESVNDGGFRDVALQNDGKIVVTSSGGSPPYRYRLLRYSAIGQLDSSFGSNGVFTSAANEGGYQLCQQADGKFAVAGSVLTNNVYYGALFRHNPDGSLDAAFGNGGKVYTVAPNTYWYAVAQQEDGKLVVGGHTPTATSNDEAALWRFQTNGLPDTGFGVNGQVISPFSNPHGWFTSLALQLDGRIVAGGVESGYLGSVFARYLNDDGTPAPADLRVSRDTVTPTTVYPSSLITYTITVTNSGPGKAGHLTFNTPTPSNTTFESFGAPAGWVVYQKPARFSPGLVSCSTYELPAGATVSFSLTVRVSPSITPGTQINHASTVWSFMPDPNNANNTLTKSVTVQ